MSVRGEQKEPSETAFISRVSLRILNALLNHCFLTAICHRERIITFRYKAKFTTGLEYRGWFRKSHYFQLLFLKERHEIDGTLSNVANMESPQLIGFNGIAKGLPEKSMLWMLTLVLAWAFLVTAWNKQLSKTYSCSLALRANASDTIMLEWKAQVWMWPAVLRCATLRLHFFFN